MHKTWRAEHILFRVIRAISKKPEENESLNAVVTSNDDAVDVRMHEFGGQ